MSTSWYQFIVSHEHILGVRLLQHISLSMSATLLAVLFGIPLGIWSYQQARVRRFILSVTNVFQTIPSLALLAFLIPLLGIGFKPTIVTLMIYALLPITRNTFIGLNEVTDEMIEAARGLGFTRWQRLRMVEFPLALPVILAGIRTATAMTIGITTIAAFIGAGGLGAFITEGLALEDPRLILLGAIPTALLALAADYVIAQFEIALSKRKRQTLRFKKTKFISATVLCGLLMASFSQHAISSFSNNRKNTVVIASKDFTESYLLSELMADRIRAKTHLHVIQKLNLGNTLIVQSALLKGAVDLYPEYTGTAYRVILKKHTTEDAKHMYQTVKSAYQKRFHLIWLQAFGFDNGQTLAVSAAFAKKYHVKSLSDLAKLRIPLSVAAPVEFIKRPDQLPLLKKAYHLHFKRIQQLQPDLVYKALQEKAVNVITVFMTDPRIQTHHLVALKDDKHTQPPYAAAPVIREAVLKAHPNIRAALAPLAGLINAKTMRHLNAEVEIQHKSPAQVAHQFLLQKRLL